MQIPRTANDMRKTTAALPGALLFLLAACGGDQFSAGEYDVSGTWTGTAEVVEGTDTAEFVFTLDLDQEEESISGSGQIQGSEETIDVDVQGEWAFPSVDLVISSPDFKSFRYTAAFDSDTTLVGTTPTPFTSPDSILGTLDGSGFDGARLGIGRQDQP